MSKEIKCSNCKKFKSIAKFDRYAKKMDGTRTYYKTCRACLRTAKDSTKRKLQRDYGNGLNLHCKSWEEIARSANLCDFIIKSAFFYKS